MQTSPIIAVTLGSNGFHLFEVAEDQGKLETINHLYENVQAESYLDDEAMFSDEPVVGNPFSCQFRVGNHLMKTFGCLGTDQIVVGHELEVIAFMLQGFDVCGERPVASH